MATKHVVVYTPIAEARGRARSLAPRLSGTLQGKTVGFLNNGWVSWGQTLEHFRRVLRERYGVAEVIERPISTVKSAPPELFEEMASRCDVVVTGLGN